MLEYLEIHRIDPDLEWIEVEAADEMNTKAIVVHLLVKDATEMATTFAKRYQSKQEIEFRLTDAVLSQCTLFFQEIHLAKVLKQKGENKPDNDSLIQTLSLHFKFPERTSYRKSKAGRIKLFHDEAFHLIQSKKFDKALKRLDWIHLLEPDNELAFELKVVVLRSTKRVTECVSVFEQWLAHYPDQWEPRLGLSELWLYLDQNQRAKDAFSALLKHQPNQVLALIGLAQAKARLGEDFLPDLLKASVIDGALVKEMVEHRFDFRRVAPKDLQPVTLAELADLYQIPLKRFIGRAQRGVVPLHLQADGLLQYSKPEMDAYYATLKRLGLEIESTPPKPNASETQLSLFEL
ncbi:MAG: hypothetical protein H6510_06225 [Acidobacteria bacterium]|nr:hypothetical protein [Acidobacteriota bacterium]MCB9397391.1 hypothetical protein [Acidobacteriota bacterium]